MTAREKGRGRSYANTVNLLSRRSVPYEVQSKDSFPGMWEGQLGENSGSFGNFGLLLATRSEAAKPESFGLE
jgi:hypothetical protein